MRSALSTAPGGAGLAPSPPPEDGRRRYFDARLKRTIVQVFQGDFYVSSQPGELLATVLGSCVAACIRDPIAKCGGMNHFLLPSERDQDQSCPAGVGLRYGSFSMEQLINGVLSAGGSRERLEIKVFGGANVVRGLSGIGHRNAEFVLEFLQDEGFKVAGQHLRGSWPRKVHYDPQTGQVRMRELKEKMATKVFDQEIQRRVRPAPAPDSGSIELFD